MKPTNKLTLGDFPHRSGKVREIYQINRNQLLLAHSDRFSAHDQIVCEIPDKGTLLTQMSQYWFEQTSHICPNHFLYARDNLMFVARCEPILVEVVIRAYMTGSTRTSLWTHYKQGARRYCGVDFPNGLVKNQKLPEVVITPTTKDPKHDEPISATDIIERKLATEKEWEYISQKALELFEFASRRALEAGFILVDTKLEFGRLPSGYIILIDEAFTCDSSRYWRASTYQSRFEADKDPEGLDKDQIRRYITENYTNELSPGTIKIPPALIQQTRQAYLDFYQTLTGEDSIHSSSSSSSSSSDIIEDNLNFSEAKILTAIQDYLINRQDPVVAIISGSEQDQEHVKKIAVALETENLNYFWLVCSAHKQTRQLMALLDELNDQVINHNRKMVIVGVAGLSNALSAVISANSPIPVIACPPLTDQNFLIDVQSSIRNPSRVPASFISRPDNVALHIRNWFQLGCRKIN